MEPTRVLDCNSYSCFTSDRCSHPFLIHLFFFFSFFRESAPSFLLSDKQRGRQPMALRLLSPAFYTLSPSFKNLPTIAISHCAIFSSLSPFASSPTPLLRAYCSSKDGVTSEKPSVRSLDDELLRRLSGAKDADQVFAAVTESGGSNGVVKMDTSDCNSLIAAAFERGNAELPLSLFDAMRLGFSPGFDFGILAKHSGTSSSFLSMFDEFCEIR